MTLPRLAGDERAARGGAGEGGTGGVRGVSELIFGRSSVDEPYRQRGILEQAARAIVLPERVRREPPHCLDVVVR